MPRVVGILLFCSFVTLSSSHRFLIVVTTGAISTSIFESSSSLHRQSYSDFTNEHLYSFHPGSLIGPGISVCTLSPHFLSGKYSWSAEEEYFLKPLPANECQCYISLRSLLQLIAELPFFFLSPPFFFWCHSFGPKLERQLGYFKYALFISLSIIQFSSFLNLWLILH